MSDSLRDTFLSRIPENIRPTDAYVRAEEQALSRDDVTPDEFSKILFETVALKRALVSEDKELNYTRDGATRALDLIAIGLMFERGWLTPKEDN